jgi:hypothetical protein
MGGGEVQMSEKNSKKCKKKEEKITNEYENNTIYIDLKEQLIKNNNYTAYTEDLLLKYMNFLKIEEELNQDIALRGVSIYWCNGGGQEGYKKNDSITELNRVNLQAIKLLNFLGIKAPEPKVKDSGDEEYEV